VVRAAKDLAIRCPTPNQGLQDRRVDLTYFSEP
jgi:hypothetical protein